MTARRRLVVLELCPKCRAPLSASHTWTRCLEDRRLTMLAAKLRRQPARREVRP
jgi:hypothetical protein